MSNGNLNRAAQTLSVFSVCTHLYQLLRAQSPKHLSNFATHPNPFGAVEPISFAIINDVKALLSHERSQGGCWSIRDVGADTNM